MNETKQKAACSFELNFRRKQKVTNGIEVKVKERERERRKEKPRRRKLQIKFAIVNKTQ